MNTNNIETRVTGTPIEKTKLELLIEQLAEKKALKAEEIRVKIEEKKLEREIENLDNPIFEQRAMEEEDMLTLNAIISSFEDLGEKAKVRRVFGFGVQVDKILTIVKSLHYAPGKDDIRTNMYANAGISEQLVEDIEDALGMSAYYSPKQNTMIEEVPGNINKLISNLKLIANDLQLHNLKLTKVTQENINAIRKRDLLQAEELMQNTIEMAEKLQDKTTYQE
jgi:hypothetical protein